METIREEDEYSFSSLITQAWPDEDFRLTSIMDNRVPLSDDVPLSSARAFLFLDAKIDDINNSIDARLDSIEKRIASLEYAVKKLQTPAQPAPGT